MYENTSPLEYGKLAPNFNLTGTDGQVYTRGQFRNRSGLVFIFFQPVSSALALLGKIAADKQEYEELNSRILGIGNASLAELEKAVHDSSLPFVLLSDNEQCVWKAYSGLDTPGYGVVILDLYGGVDAQKFVTSVEQMPDAATILEWTRAAQYKCNI